MICYDYINDYIKNTISDLNDELLVEMEEYAKVNHVPIITPEVAKLITILGMLKKPSNILEVGTAIGYSSILLSKILNTNGKIDTIDRYELMINIARENIKKAGLENRINIIPGDALDVLKSMNNSYDIIFLDGAKGQYINFLPECLRMLNKGGLLITDNVLYKGMIANDSLVVRRKKTIVKRLRNYLDVICNHDELETCILSIGDGVAVSCRK